MLGHIFDGAAVVETVCQFDEHHPDIVSHSEQDALEVLCLEAFAAHGRALPVLIVQNRLDLGEPVHERGYLVPEEAAYVFYGITRVLHHVVQHGGADGLVAQTDLGDDDLGDFDGMKYVRLPGTPPDVFVGLICKFAGLDDHLDFLLVSASGTGYFKEISELLVNKPVILFCELRETHIVLSLSHSWDFTFSSTYWKP